MHAARPRSGQRRGWVVLLLAAAGASIAATAVRDPVALGIRSPPDNEWVRLDATPAEGMAIVVESSSDLAGWEPLATTHERLVGYPDPRPPGPARWRYYRALTRPLGPEDDWKNQLHYPDDPFLSLAAPAPEDIRWVKFCILLDAPHRVIFQDSQRHLFHYGFATERLAPFHGMSPDAFDRVSLYGENQQVLLGAVLFPPPPNQAEYGIQFVGLDPYPAGAIRDSFTLVREVIAAPPGVQALYFPTYEQAGVAASNAAWFADAGIPVSSVTRWLRDAQTYAPGWAVARLVYVPAAGIAAAFAAGDLRPDDILLTDAVPAEIPVLAGVVCLSPATPNAHAAILARTFGIPFAFLADPADQARALTLHLRRVAFCAAESYAGDRVRLIDLEDELNPELEAELLALKAPPALTILPRVPCGQLSAPADGLTPADIVCFGGKAANFGFLRREIPANCPSAIALSFDLWEAYLAQVLPGGQTLREVIAARLDGHAYPPDMATLLADLAAVRGLIRNVADFTPDQRAALVAALAGFDPARTIRFRSSTNMEDTQQFTGAGLYDSFSGCLLDDLDGDTAGPSQCDPAEADERGVFRAIRKVFASFYNDNAFLERLRHGIDEDDVGMAVLVHHSFPDDIELANGVARLDVRKQTSGLQMSGELVTQRGAVPVTNPEGNALPEVVQVSRYSFGTYLAREQASSLVPLGGSVLDWDAEYRALVDLFTAVAAGYAAAFPAKPRFMLDFEYKKIVPDGLVVKQVREIPLPDPSETAVPFLLNEPAAFGVFQGERADVFSNHRLKSQWLLATRCLRLAETNLATGIYREASHEYIDDGQLAALAGPPADWPDAGYRLETDAAVDRWGLGEGDRRRMFELRTLLPPALPAGQPPLVTVSDLELQLWAHYAAPQPALDYEGTPVSVTTEVAILAPCPLPTATDLRQDRHLACADGRIVIEIGFYWPKYPGGIDAGYTAPLVRWDQTRITGLTTQPIELRGGYSQTYRPGHHNFTEEFIFEPRLEPDLPAATRQELEAGDIVLLHLHIGLPDPRLRLLGHDGHWR